MKPCEKCSVPTNNPRFCSHDCFYKTKKFSKKEGYVWKEKRIKKLKEIWGMN